MTARFQMVYHKAARRPWRPELHPRDAYGRFIRVGAGVITSRGHRGRVTGHRGEHVEVQTGHGTQMRLPRRMVTVHDGSGVDRRGPLTDEEFAARQAHVEKAVGAARKTLATEITHAEDGVWHPDRDRIHREIAAELYGRASHVPNEGKSVIAGGLGGAGKTTVLKDHAGIDPKGFFTINPDDIKELMAERGLVPEVPDAPDLSPMERAALVHEESSRIAQLMADMAYRDRKNLIWDITMSSEGSVRSRVAKLKGAGYSDITGVFVDIPVEVSVERALSRYRRGVDQWNAGKGLGGRFVPPAVIRAQKTSSGSTVNRGVFDTLKGEFSTWSVYDNSVTGRAPKLVESSRGATTGA